VAGKETTDGCCKPALGMFATIDSGFPLASRGHPRTRHLSPNRTRAHPLALQAARTSNSWHQRYELNSEPIRVLQSHDQAL